MQNYKDLKVWEKAHSFTLKVYEYASQFPKEEMYSLTSQLKRSASSIPANIAEGCGKNSKQEFAHFLNIALGSANESEYFVILARDLTYLSEQNFNTLFNIINEVKGMLIALINKVRA
ncbi:four helix bundle protein [Panacibacter sp. DH6]|uniref:Four helix bundle protein n=1 Tax=Panacibacter microcysteis TaxID=2793269 RepID=A0A931E861_9BACT|nr:four helix bundle protein [Panacibacter microcysteis]MBG9376029.1 four helix bundle protein [Panacibacter microcysteis]